MALIVDANCSTRVFAQNPTDDFLPVIECLRQRRNSMHYGGTKLLQEYAKTKTVLRTILSLDRAGIAKRIDDDKVDTKESELVDESQCESNDPHIVALALVGGAKVLISHDVALHQDFKKIAKGSIYQCSDHLPLLRL
ncbi:MAG: hypothetical protein ACRCV9_06395 [Burkholderiaceae bacterium]